MRLRRLLGTSPTPPPAPDAPFTVLGDVHGRDDLLARALERAAHPVVCVGDVVDRGPGSAAVLDQLAGRADIVCLMGNHEEMMLDFLDAVPGSERWPRHGGAATLESFGVAVPEADADAAPARAALARAMGPALLDWLRARPSSWRSGNMAVTHAGADPDLPIEAQSDAVLRWGHPGFGRRRRDGLWVLRGHVVVAAPVIRHSSVSIDTGAWATDRLTMAHVRAGDVTFEEA